MMWILILQFCIHAQDAKPWYDLQFSQKIILARNRKSAPIHLAGSASNFSWIILTDRAILGA